MSTCSGQRSAHVGGACCQDSAGVELQHETPWAAALIRIGGRFSKLTFGHQSALETRSLSSQVRSSVRLQFQFHQHVIAVQSRDPT